MKTYRTNPNERSRIEQHFRNMAAQSLSDYRAIKNSNSKLAPIWQGKATAFCHAAEKVALDQMVNQTIESTKQAIRSI